MTSEIMAQYGAKLAIAVVVVAAALFVLFLVSRAIRNRGTSAFLRGGNNRTPRLAVLDAAAVDQHRRLVLVRRDTVEHLILIGGPTDIVVESGIGASGPAERPGPDIRRVVAEDRRAEAAQRTTARPAPEIRQEPAPARPTPARTHSAAETQPRSAAPTADAPIQTPEARPTERPANPPRVDAPVSPARRPDDARRAAEDVLDGARDRVLGPAADIRPMTTRATTERPSSDSPAWPRPGVPRSEPDEGPAGGRFEDVLDARAPTVSPDHAARTAPGSRPALETMGRGAGARPAGDLSDVQPALTAAERLGVTGGRPDGWEPGDPVLDDEMSKLLNDLTPRR